MLVPKKKDVIHFFEAYIQIKIEPHSKIRLSNILCLWMGMERYFQKEYLLNLVIFYRNLYIGMCVCGKVFNLKFIFLKAIC
jgi:hypothetical protein